MNSDFPYNRSACIFLRATLFLTLAVSVVQGEVRLPTLFADHMVVQREAPVHVWGVAEPGESVNVSFRGETRSTTADELGRWNLYLSPAAAGGPFVMAIKGTNSIVLQDVMAGDVWVASGQSNMEFALDSLRDAEAEISNAQYPKIRIFHVKRTASDYPLTDVKAKTWAPCSPATAAEVSAVAYFFGREIQKKTGVSVGLVESYWGGTPAEAWTSLTALASDASLMPVFAARAHVVEKEAVTRLQLEAEEHDFQKALAQARAEGKPAPNREWHPEFQAWAPATLFNGMIAPLTPFPIRGVIWYQGEANTDRERAFLYARVFQTMIRSWRQAWGQGDFPFLFVQIANFISKPDELWPEVRDAQRQALALRNTAMVVTIDIGDADDIHPKNKQDVGARLALAARAIAYGEKIEYSGPLVRQVTQGDQSLRVWFDHAEGGVIARGDVVKGFEIAAADRQFAPAQARIEGNSVLVSNPSITKPVFVRYGWAANPDCNVFNRAGLPASPFMEPE